MHVYDFDEEKWKPDEKGPSKHVPDVKADFKPLDEALELICRSCFLVANRFTSPDGVRCQECAELDRPVYDRR